MNNETKRTLTLSEIKAMLPTTKGIKRRPTAASLRTDVKLLLNSESGDSTMQLYENGFAVYSNGKHETVIRVEYIGKAEYEFHESDGHIRRGGVPLEDAPWDVAVFIDGEERIKTELDKRDTRRLVSTTGTGGVNDNGEQEDMEFDAGARIENEVVITDTVNRVLDCLTEQQRRIMTMRFILDMPQKEIAKELGISEPVVSKTIAAAKKVIRKKYKKF